jgi:hypothetical protein|tara:strand:+ start:377 stop:745 length:369 start_codon:yes stop_codon:yes gene_type:complete
MQLFDKLTDDNLLLYAARYYYNPTCIDPEEFYEDLNRFKYIKRLVNKYLETGNISERLILNHMITVFNAFDIKPTLRILEFKFDGRQWEVLKPFLVFLKHIKNDEYVEIKMDKHVIEQLRKI